MVGFRAATLGRHSTQGCFNPNFLAQATLTQLFVGAHVGPVVGYLQAAFGAPEGVRPLSET